MNNTLGNTDPAEFSLTEAQVGLWYAQQLAPENSAFNTAHLLWIDGQLDVAKFQTAVNQATQEADALSLQISDRQQGPTQFVDENRRPWLQVFDLSGSKNPQQTARDQIESNRSTPVDFKNGAVACQWLLKLSESEYVWYVRVHHLVTDGYGMALYSDRVCSLYSSLLSPEIQPGVPFSPLQPVFEEAKNYLEADKRKRDSEYWHETLKGMPAACGLGAGFASAASEALRLIRPVEKEFQEKLHQVSSEIGQPWPDLLTALIAEYCRRMSGVEEAVVGVPFMGRLGSVSARVPMMVMNVLPLRSETPSNLSVAEFVQKTARQLLKGRRHGRYRGEQLRRDLGLIGGQRRLHGPIINIQPFYRPPQLWGTQVRLEILSTGPVDDANIGFRGDAISMLDLEIEANPRLYREQDLTAHADRLLSFLSSAFDVHFRNGKMSDVVLSTPVEQKRYLFDVNETSHPVPDTTLVALFEEQMQRTPAASSLEFEGEVLTYYELEQRTRALAIQLRKLGVGRESIVGVALERSLELVVALLAIQRAGGAYLPLDLSHPDHRIATILESATPVCVLCTSENASRFQNIADVLATEQWERNSSEVLDSNVRPEDAAYVIYTSGSTGVPKGVVIEHRAIVNRLLWMKTFYDFREDDRFLQKTPATFDVSVWEFFLPFLTGSTLVVAPPEAHRDPVALASLTRESRITTLHFVPSMLSAFLASPASKGLQLRRVFCSGEELTAEQRELFHQKIEAELHNLYGPTEAAVDVSYWPASPEDQSRPVPIGFPVWNTQLYVLDEQLRPVPPGVAGDLYLGGVQLARGYLGREDLTSERFLSSPFRPGERIYQTGDIAQWREDGAVVYLGRSDHQVKLRGLRIELGEIEAVLQSVPEVLQAEVIVREDRPGEKRLVAYLQTQNGFNLDDCRKNLASQIPDYMVPTAFVELQTWPVTSNGKLDRKALPAPSVQIGESIPLQSETEQQLAVLFTEILGLQASIGAEADFFSLGGDSLQAVHLLLAIEKQWQRNPGLESLFTNPTITNLAKIIDTGATDSKQGLGPIIKLSEGDQGLSPLFVIHPAGGICWNYRELAYQLEPRRQVFGIQSPELDAEQKSPESIELLAEQYCQRVIQLASQGPIHLAGWSVGGIIAQAMAVRLQKQGHQPGLVALFDAYPCECWRKEPEPEPIKALRALLAIAGYDPEGHPELDTRHKIVAFLRQGKSGLGNLPEAVLDGVIRAVTGTNRLIREHYHEKYEGTLLHLRAGKDHSNRPELQSQLWTPYAAEVESIELPFLHAELTGRQASLVIAKLLNERLQVWDNSPENQCAGAER